MAEVGNPEEIPVRFIKVQLEPKRKVGPPYDVDEEEEEEELEEEEEVDSEEGGEEREEKDRVNCLFCYAPVPNYNVDKLMKGVLRKTSQRLLEYICNHLSIEAPQDAPRLIGRQPKEKRLHPHNLPLCGKCTKLYYYKVYDTFVEYESTVAKLNSQIASHITKVIAASAKRHKKSVEVEVCVEPNEENNMFSKFFHSLNDHQVMLEVKKFRTKVVDKNPLGCVAPNPSDSSSTPSSSAQAKEGEARPTTSESTSLPKPSNLNIIKIVRRGPGQFGREFTQDKIENLTDQLKETEESKDEDIVEIPTDANRSLNCYAVSNPAPGVIQIIPMNVSEESSGGRKKRKRKRREPVYAEQRRNMYTCKFCNQYFPGHAKLAFHQVKVHGMEKPIQCEKCDHKFIDKGSLKAHMITHLDESEKEVYKKFACHICPMKYRTKKHLEGHIRSHFGEKPFTCNVCGKSFTSKVSLNLCLDKHNGVKNHKCPYCGQTFLRREVLKIHVRTHTGEKPFSCQICGKAFAQRSPLTIHLKVHEKLGSSYVPRPPRNVKVKKDKD